MKHPIKLFDSNETNFKHNKNVLNECTSAYITEDIEGTLELDLEYPLFDKKNLSNQFSIGKIIKSPIYDNRPDQLFKIRKPTLSTSNKYVSIYAQAIGYADLSSNIVLGCHIPDGKTRKQAIEMLLNARQQKIRDYHVGDLDTNTNTNVNLGLDESTGEIINYVDIDYKSPLKGLLDDSENSIYKAYRGELIWNNFEINMVDKRGSDNKFTIRSGKNIQDLEREISDMDDNFATALIMCSSDGLYLPNNEIIFSPLADQYDRYYYKVIKCDDVSLEDLITEHSTEEDIEKAKQIVYEQLRERAQNYFNEGMAELLGSYTINFLELAKSEEYKNYASLTNCSIGNEVTTIYPELDLKVTTRVTKIKYNVLKDEIEEITVGNIKKDITDSVISTENKVEEVKQDATNTKFSLKKNTKEINASIDILDKKIELKISSDDMWSLIEMYPEKILLAVNDEKNGTDVIINTKGLEVHKGKFALYDSGNNKIFGVNQSGKVAVYENINIQKSDGTDAYVSTNGLYFQNSEGRTIARFACIDNQDIVVESKNGYINLKSDDIRINGQALDDYIKDVVG